MSGGSAGAGGYHFQAEVAAVVAALMLAGQPLRWLEGERRDVPAAVQLETGGPGDDLQIVLDDGGRVEVQAKRGLRGHGRLWAFLDRLLRGLHEDGHLLGVWLVDPTTSGPVIWLGADRFRALEATTRPSAS